jgi:beta-lactamase regulating signal transducer with metallopeptidase domain
MSALASWVTPATTHTAALAILHFLWQGAALAALAFAAMSLTKSAAKRYATAVAILVLMVAAPLVTFFVLQQRHAAQDLVAQNTSIGARTGTAATLRMPHSKFSSEPAIPSSPDYLPWLVQAWLAGVLLLSLRPAAGFFALRRIRSQHSKAVTARLSERCLALQDRLGITRVIRFCECAALEAPAVIGWLCPVVYLPLSAITGLSAEQLDAVIAHELAHIKRFDAFVNLFQIAAETLLFYHPAVWWLSKRIRAERENCCDDIAVAVCGDATSYARALASMAEWQAAPSLAMAANRHPLAARVSRILGMTKLRDGLRGASLAASILCLTVSLFAGHALFGAGHAAAQPHAPTAPDVPTPSVVAPVARTVPPVTPSSGTASLVTPTAPSAIAPVTASPAPVIVITTVLADSSAQEAAAQEKTAAESPSKSSYIDALKAAGLDDLTIDQLVELKVQGVTPEFVREIKALGLQVDADEITAMKIQGVTPEFIRQIRALGLQVDSDEIVAMKIQGITPDYLKQMNDLGFHAGADEVIALKVQSITPDYVKSLRALGLKADLDDTIAMKVQSITPDYVKQLQDLHIVVDVDDAIAMKVQSVTPEYVKALRDMGLKADAESVIAMKVQSVSPEYVLELKNLSLNVDADQVVALKIQGVTPEYVKALRAAGLQLDVDDLIAAKIQGITPEFIERARKHGFQNLDLDKLMKLKHTGILDQ